MNSPTQSQILTAGNISLIRTPAPLKAIAADFASQLLSHPFLMRCADGSVTREELNHLLIQQGKYSQYFTRYLCALISQLNNNKDVLQLAENLSEELGFGHDDDARIPHSHIYTEMLGHFGLNLDDAETLPETQALIDVMFMLCRQPSGVHGLAAMCLGAEAVVPSLYSRFVEGFRANGVHDDELKFFTIHIECDDGHAETMFDMLANLVQNSNANLVTARQAGEMVINARLRMFDALMKKDH